MSEKQANILEYILANSKIFDKAQESYLKEWGYFFKGTVSHPGMPDGIIPPKAVEWKEGNTSEENYLNFWKHIYLEPKFVVINKMLVSKKIIKFHRPDSKPTHLLNIPAKLTFSQKKNAKLWVLKIEYQDSQGLFSCSVNKNGLKDPWEKKSLVKSKT